MLIEPRRPVRADLFPDPTRGTRRERIIRINPVLDAGGSLSHKGAPWAKQDDEKPRGETIAYERLLQAWKEGRVQ